MREGKGRDVSSTERGGRVSEGGVGTHPGSFPPFLLCLVRERNRCRRSFRVTVKASVHSYAMPPNEDVGKTTAGQPRSELGRDLGSLTLLLRNIAAPLHGDRDWPPQPR